MSASLKNLNNFKSKKPIYKSRSFWISLASLLVFSGLVYLVSFASFLQVENIEVAENEEVTEEAVRKIVKANMTRKLPFASSNSVLLVEAKKIEQKINEEFSVLYDVKVRRRPPSSLKVIVKERKPVGIFNGDYLIDKRGVAFQATSSQEGFLINKSMRKEVSEGQEVISKETMNKILTIKSNLEDFNLKSASLKSKTRLDITTQAGWKAYFALDKDWKWQISELKIALQREISETEWSDLDYIDLRFDKVYYK